MRIGFEPGQRVAGMYMNERGATVLDYTGVVVSVTPAELWPRLEIRYSDGRARTTSAHPDFVIPMAAPIDWARRVHATAPATPAVPAAVAAVLCEQGHSLSMHELIRVVWVLRFDRDALAGAEDGFVPVPPVRGTSIR
ncbi:MULTISPECIES: hypothetical protein [Curtobacterium]|uniref:Uncharacterized protein n=3 Tax=Curtobacterium TaxID=2034 RepID=A0A6N1CWH8_9MICO|nr:hypothetical protein [Curtobacterium flaccumfaciens]MBO9044972.1 hypothetical protein [Curtobacterium flaccumfaciens pv. flaccumfaciens]MBO9048885.1 hypothetical protein [Curtobacterium flaccumfaciens pv. flaccumfaciens]MBO9057736.1 hypothetical protein [Curtobacterium flaccumfaciens pv. flaccumfaciens]MBT1543175.1 hypothetical protein [Curtobacterium flaccumfaciens pv. flaccumfaciens]MBT1546157.1 hypothetical protein [Curtobacterium flaccumfaciens pv. flaccumfaciens]